MEEEKTEKQENKVKRIIINTILWIISIFFIISGLLFINQVIVPAICILIAGIMLLPPVNDKIKNTLKNKKYIAIKNVFIIILFIVFCLNISTTNNNTEITSTTPPESTNTINQNNIQETIANTATEKNGTYTGDREKGKKSGTGIFIWNDGSIYEGQWKNDKINGQGKLIIPNKGTYEGNFDNGRKSGQGKYTFANGDIYEGNFIYDKMSGQGKYTFSNGETYEGTFSDNKFNGQGTYTISGKKYTGTWKNNEYKK